MIIGTDSLYNNINTAKVSDNKTQKLEQSLKGDLKNADDKELMEVCKTFESYMIEQVLKEMKKTVPENETDNEYTEYFGDMMYQEYAKDMTESQSLGIAQMLYESMKRS